MPDSKSGGTTKPNQATFASDPLVGGRQEKGRLDRVKEQGCSNKTEKAVDDALAWLARHQERAGNWKPGQAVEQHTETGLTGLATLAFLGAGHTHLSKTKYSKNVQYGLEWLIYTQKSDGNLMGSARIYCHAIATLALCEAYGMTKDERIRPSAQKAVTWLVRAQHSTTGGWRYQPGQRGDTSVFGWVIMALRAGRHAGLYVPDSTWTKAKIFLTTVSSGKGGGLASYRPGYKVSETMTAEALVCRQIFGQPSTDDGPTTALQYIQLKQPTVSNYNIYYWYYGTLALHSVGGKPWKDWNEKLVDILVKTQATKGDDAGSWDPRKPYGVDGGRVFSTATSALCLQVYYRYAPAYAQQEKKKSVQR